MSGCGCSFTPVENKETEEIKYTDALAEQFAAEVVQKGQDYFFHACYSSSQILKGRDGIQIGRAHV